LSVASDTRAALYHRVSTVDQNQHAARTELRAAARRLGLRVVLDVRETGSRANNQRPGLVKVLEAAQRGDVNAVLVWKLDRFGRSAFDLLGNIRQLEAAGVRFVAIGRVSPLAYAHVIPSGTYHFKVTPAPSDAPGG
jgi:DNA invertase Pin-like site-specific DNA recombinase